MRDAMSEFASAWIRAWNSNNLEELLSHYQEAVVFTSPRAQTVTGTALIRGKDALRAYWGAAIQRATSRHFTLERIIWDPECSELVIVYLNETTAARVRACEIFRFDADGRVAEGEALYGAHL